MWQEIWDRKNKTLLFLIDLHKYAQQASLAQRLPHVRIIDWREEFLRNARPHQKYLNLTAQCELDRIKAWSESNSQAILCVINTDYALTRLNYKTRQIFWHGFWKDFPYGKSIILYAVLNSPELLPDNLDEWEAKGRIVRGENVGG